MYVYVRELLFFFSTQLLNPFQNGSGRRDVGHELGDLCDTFDKSKRKVALRWFIRTGDQLRAKKQMTVHTFSAVCRETDTEWTWSWTILSRRSLLID